MIAGGIERIRELATDAAPVVVDRRRFAVHDPRRAHDRAAEGGADRLMAEADAENRNLAGETLDEGHRNAGLLRRAWTGGDDDALRAVLGDLGKRDGVVPPHVDVGAELA